MSFLSRHDIQMCRIISLPFDIQDHIWKMYFSKYVLNNIPLACWAYNDTFKERGLIADLQGNPLPLMGIQFAWDNLYIYTPSQPGITRLVRHRPKPMSCMQRNIGHAHLSPILVLQICEFWSKFVNSAARIPRRSPQFRTLQQIRSAQTRSVRSC